MHDEIIGHADGLRDAAREWRRIAFRRSAAADHLGWAHRSTIPLLDEATSDLDTVTERMLHHNLSTLGCMRTVIAHRLSTIVDADLILVMEEGRIVQRGTQDGARRCHCRAGTEPTSLQYLGRG
jgi:ABC-type transport system involved in cytochrome bd biosynthesis fused ATPase/permease subunit